MKMAFRRMKTLFRRIGHLSPVFLYFLCIVIILLIVNTLTSVTAASPYNTALKLMYPITVVYNPNHYFTQAEDVTVRSTARFSAFLFVDKEAENLSRSVYTYYQSLFDIGSTAWSSV